MSTLKTTVTQQKIQRMTTRPFLTMVKITKHLCSRIRLILKNKIKETDFLSKRAKTLSVISRFRQERLVKL